MAIYRVSISSPASVAIAALLFLSALLPALSDDAAAPEEPSAVLTLDATNFDEVVSKHPFIVVEFYAPWCGHCKNLAPEYEKAAAILSKHDPPVVLAKVDANENVNKDLAAKYEVSGFPTLKILKNEGKTVLEYKGPREADGIVEYLKKQVGPPSVKIETAEDFSNSFDLKKVVIVGIFQEFSGEEYQNYIAVADKLRSDYDFAHTTNAQILPRGDSSVKQPTVRLFKPFDELFVDFQDFKVDALESFIESASMPTVATFNSEPDNRPFLIKFFNSPDSKAMLFLNFSSDEFDSFKTKLHEAAVKYKENKINFLIGDLDASQGAFQYFGLRDDMVPVIIIQESDGKKYLQANVKSDGIDTWVKDYLDGSLKPYQKSAPIPEVNNEPVKVVVADSLKEIVFDSRKNVLLEFYAPWCGHCKKLEPILDEVAVSLQKDDDVVIAKMDATANDVPKEFDVKGYPTLYFSSASGKLSQYDGDRSAQDIIDFVNKNKDAKSQPDIAEPLKDEL